MATQKKFKYNIDKFKFRNKEDSEEQANKIIFIVIQNVIKDDTDPFDKLFSVTEFLMEITNKNLLLKTKSLFSDMDFSELSEKISSKINIEKHLYSVKQITRIFAIIIGNYIRYERMKPKDSKEFSFKIKGNNITVLNIDYFSNFKRKIVLELPKIFKSDLKAYDQLIGEMSNHDYERGTESLESEIKFLERQKNSISAPEMEREENKYEDIFKKGAFIKFEKWVKKNTEVPYKKFSFIFQRLNADNELRTNNFKKITSWLLESNYMTKIEHEYIFFEKGYLNWDTPRNILTKGRNELYDLLIEKNTY